MVNANYEFLVVDVGANERVSDVVYSNTAFYKKLIKRLLEPGNLSSTQVKMLYVFTVSRSRWIIENVFGILASRFKIVLNRINLCHEKTITIVLACCYLHIFSRNKKVEAYVQDGIDVENMNTGELTNADWRSESVIKFTVT